MYKIDGSVGGGSVLRVAVPIALAEKEPIRIYNIRKSRSNPGLRPQHLKGLHLLCDITGSNLNGATVGSSEIEIIPGDDHRQKATIHITTAGSISLVYQLLSNYCLISEKKVEIDFEGGGTHTKWSPNFDYLEQVTIPALRLFGQEGNIQTAQVGYYPKGGAKGRFRIEQKDAPELIELDVVEGSAPLKVLSRATEQLRSSKVAERQVQGLLNQGIVIDEEKEKYDQSLSIGSSLTCWMVEIGELYRGYSFLGEKGVAAEVIGRRVAQQIVEFEEPAAVDEYLGDQLMVALSQAESGSYYTIPKITQHVTTNFDLINTMLSDSLKLQHHSDYYIIQKI